MFFHSHALLRLNLSFSKWAILPRDVFRTAVSPGRAEGFSMLAQSHKLSDAKDGDCGKEGDKIGKKSYFGYDMASEAVNKKIKKYAMAIKKRIFAASKFAI